MNLVDYNCKENYLSILKIRKWEKELHQIYGDSEHEQLAHAGEQQITLYLNSLPKPGMCAIDVH